MSHLPARLTALKPIHVLLLVAVSLAMFLPGFFTIPPFDRDESRYAQASHQMLETRDFVDIRFQEEARHKKPVGIYWLQSASVTLLTGGAEHGPIWMYRIPSLLGAIAAVLLTAWAGARLFGATVGVGAGLMMAATVILGVEARMAKTDAVLLATIVAAQGALLRVYLDRLKPIPPSLPLLLVFWVAVGASILVKGPIILMVTGGTIVMLGVMDRGLGWLRRLRPAIGVPVMLAVVLPWLVAIGIETQGAFFSYAIGHEFLGKAHSVQENHWGPPGYYLLTFWLTFWPWSLFAALALPWVWRNRTDQAVRFCVAWIVPTWLIFEIVTTKLPHYTIVVFPAIACLTVAAALDRFEAPSLRRTAGFWAAAAFFLLITVVFAGAAVWGAMDVQGALVPLSILAAVLILATGVAAVVLEKQREPNRLMVGVLAGAFATWATVHGAVLPRLDAMWVSPRVQAVVDAHRPCPTTILAAAGYTEPSMVFLVGTKTVLGGPEKVAAHMLADPACAIGMVKEGEDSKLFLDAMRTAGVPVREVDAISGFNYSRGHRLTLRFFVADAAAAPAGTQPTGQ